jgi:hypothetical protein
VGDDPFGDPFRIAENAAGIGGLVGGDVDKPLDARRVSRLEHVERSPNVGLERLLRILLKEWKVLECCGVEDDLGSAASEEPVHRLAISDVEQYEIGRLEKRPALNGELYRV